MKNLAILLLALSFASILLNIHTCNELKNSKEVSKSEIESSQQKVSNLKQEVNNLKDSITNSDSRTDTIIKYKNIDRVISSKKISAIKELTLNAADSIWNKKYSSKKQSLVADAKCDSLLLDYRSLTDLHHESIKKSKFLSSSLIKKGTIISELEFQNSSCLNNLDLSEKKLKEQKLKKWGYLIFGLLGGFTYAEIRK